MKTKVIVLSCLISVVVLSICYECTWAAPEAEKSALGIGVVSVRKIFKNCKRNEEYKKEAKAKQNKIIAELEKLRKEIEAEEAGLKTLKAGSSDHMSQVKEILIKRANLQAQQEFYTKQIELEDQQWTEKLYQDILKETHNVAEQKELHLVFENDEVELPSLSANELMLTIRTHKLLYSGGCLDITSDVMGRIDAEK